jgi:CubicO group peptidase (beta-lactamase class C family)
VKKIQESVQALLDRLVGQGLERGVQVAAYFEGERVVDAFAGIADAATGRAVDGDTLFPIFSTGKGIEATLVHLLVERGKVGYETRIAEVWPEFAAHGKEGITLRQALNHTAGVPNMPVGIGHAELGDWDTMCAAIADLRPVSAPGVEMAYHAITYSWTLGEVARRVDGRSFPRLLREEIGVPLGLTQELFMGLPDEMAERVAVLESGTDESKNAPLPNDATPQAIPTWMQPLDVWMNRTDARRACIPASNGIMTARAIARHYGALLPGGVDGVELLSPERIRLATELQLPGHGREEPPPMRQALGYQLGSPFSASSFGHSGYGGSRGFADPDSKLAVGFTRNRFFAGGEDSPVRIMELFQEALKGS